MGKTLFIELPESALIPDEVVQNQDLLRYILAGSLYSQQILTEKEAREVTGDPRRVFSQKMARYGFCLMPESDRDLALELKA